MIYLTFICIILIFFISLYQRNKMKNIKAKEENNEFLIKRKTWKE